MFRILFVSMWVLLLAACGAAAPPAAERPTAEVPPTQQSLGAEPTSMLVATPVDTTLQVPADDPRSLGDPNAPVTIIEYSDYE